MNFIKKLFTKTYDRDYLIDIKNKWVVGEHYMFCGHEYICCYIIDCIGSEKDCKTVDIVVMFDKERFNKNNDMSAFDCNRLNIPYKPGLQLFKQSEDFRIKNIAWYIKTLSDYRNSFIGYTPIRYKYFDSTWLNKTLEKICKFTRSSFSSVNIGQVYKLYNTNELIRDHFSDEFYAYYINKNKFTALDPEYVWYVFVEGVFDKEIKSDEELYSYIEQYCAIKEKPFLFYNIYQNKSNPFDKKIGYSFFVKNNNLENKILCGIYDNCYISKSKDDDIVKLPGYTENEIRDMIKTVQARKTVINSNYKFE